MLKFVVGVMHSVVIVPIIITTVVEGTTGKVCVISPLGTRSRIGDEQHPQSPRFCQP